MGERVDAFIDRHEAAFIFLASLALAAGAIAVSNLVASPDVGSAPNLDAPSGVEPESLPVEIPPPLSD